MSNRTVSKIPKFKSNCNRQKTDIKYKKQNDSSYMQLNITKVYFLKKRTKDEKEENHENFEGSITELANKISTICNKIKDVESYMFLGKNLLNTQLEALPTCNVNLINNRHNIKKQDYDDAKLKNKDFHYGIETKRFENCLNVNNSSSLFSQSEFSFEKWEKSVQTKSRTDFLLNDSEKWPLKFILGELAQRTEEIMKKMSNIDHQIKKIVPYKDDGQKEDPRDHCQHCKSVYAILCDQKKQISNIAQTLTECISNFPEKFQNQKNVRILQFFLLTYYNFVFSSFLEWTLMFA